MRPVDAGAIAKSATRSGTRHADFIFLLFQKLGLYQGTKFKRGVGELKIVIPRALPRDLAFLNSMKDHGKHRVPRR